MKFLLCAWMLVATGAADVNGNWKAVFTGPREERPKVPGDIVLDLKVEGTKLTGMAHMAPWPGDAPLSDGKIDGDRVSFTVVGKRPSYSSVAGTTYPTLVFTGTVHGNEMDITLQWGHQYPMHARKTAD